MKYLAAYVLLALGGNTSPDEAAISKLLSSVGIESESERVSKLVSELSGKNVWEVIEAGRAKLAQVPSGGGGGGGGAAAASAPAASAAAQPAKPAPVEEKKEEEKVEEEEEDLGLSLFD